MALVGLALSGCASPQPESARPPSTPQPFSIDGGLGSQHGNYPARANGEIAGPDGERCLVFEWDRPLSDKIAVRYVSASCPSADRPGRMVARHISRTVIPLPEGLVGQ